MLTSAAREHHMTLKFVSITSNSDVKQVKMQWTPLNPLSKLVKWNTVVPEHTPFGHDYTQSSSFISHLVVRPSNPLCFSTLPGNLRSLSVFRLSKLWKRNSSMFVFPSIHHPSNGLSVCLSIHSSTHPTNGLSIHSSIHLSISHCLWY